MTQVYVPCEWQFQTSSPNVDMIMTKDNYKITRQTYYQLFIMFNMHYNTVCPASYHSLPTCCWDMSDHSDDGVGTRYMETAFCGLIS